MIYVTLGWCAVALALVGIVMPGMPTTVFVLGASYCFSRSSPRFERWLRENRWLGPSVRRFAHSGGMPPSAKRAALSAMWLAIALSSVVLVAIHWAAAAGTVGLGVVGTSWILWGIKTEMAANPEENAANMDVVGATGFEPATSRSRTERSTRLSHAPAKHQV